MRSGTAIAVVGAGLVGSGWSLVFARAGHDVRVYDPDPDVRDGVMAWVADTAAEMHDAGLLGPSESVLPHIRICDSLEEALDGAGYVQESVFESVETKTEVAKAIDVLIDPDAIVGSSSSGIPASRFTAECRNRARFLIAHPVNPPHLVPVVELVPAPWTDPDAVTATRAMMLAAGQVPVSITAEIEGFILNRLQGALLNEAFALYAEGYASLEDIDATVAHGLGLRWCFMGPFETIDLNAPGGLADYADRLGGMYFRMAQMRVPAQWDPETISRADAARRGRLGRDALAARRAWRDSTLMQLARFKRDQGLGS